MGDTSLYPEMTEIPDLLGRRLDLIAVPIAGWGPRLSPGHLGPREAVEACVRSGARWALPVHWGTLHPRCPPCSARAGWTVPTTSSSSCCAAKRRTAGWSS